MYNTSKYSKEVIKEGQKMRKQGFSFKVIMAELGFETKQDVMYHCSPEFRAKHKISQNRYRVAHADELKEKFRIYIKKYRAKKKLQHENKTS